MSQLMCRTCLATCGELVPIFSDDCYVNDLPDKLLNTIRLEVQKDDELPKVMCKKCIFLVDSLNCFKDQCEMAEIKLKSEFKSLLPSIGNVGQLLSELENMDKSYENISSSQPVETSSEEDYQIEYASEEARLEVENARKQRRMAKNPYKKSSGVKVKSVEILPTESKKNIYKNLSASSSTTKHDFPVAKEDFDISDSDDALSMYASEESSKYSSNMDTKNYNNSLYSKIDEKLYHTSDIKEITKKKQQSDSSFNLLSKVPKKVLFKDDNDDSDMHCIERTKNDSRYHDKTVSSKIMKRENTGISDSEYNTGNTSPIKITCSTFLKRELPTIASNGDPSDTRLKKLLANFTLDFPEICIICSASFETPLEVLKHKLESHLKQDQECFFCPICHNQYYSNRELVNHVNIHNDVCSLVCGLCSGPFYTRKSLRAHLESHVDLYDLRCKTCSKKFQHIQSLLVHLKQHITSDHLTCMLCPSKFTSIEQLQSHIDKAHRKHLVHKNSKCETCGMRLSKRELVNHVKVHDAHLCPDCNKSFVEKELLREHIQTHINSKVPKKKTKFSCLACDKAFDSIDKRTKHMEEQHMTSQKQQELRPIEEPQNENQSKEQQEHYEKQKILAMLPQSPPPRLNDHKKFRCRVCHGIFVSRYVYGQHLKEKHWNSKQTSEILKELSESSVNEQLLSKNNDLLGS